MGAGAKGVMVHGIINIWINKKDVGKSRTELVEVLEFVLFGPEQISKPMLHWKKQAEALWRITG